MVPDQSVPEKLTFLHVAENGDHYQVGYIAQDPTVVAPNSTATLPSHLFAGTKIVRLLDRYKSEYIFPISTRRWISAGFI